MRHDVPAHVDYRLADPVDGFDLLLKHARPLRRPTLGRVTEDDIDCDLIAVDRNIINGLSLDRVGIGVGINDFAQGVFYLRLGNTCHICKPLLLVVFRGVLAGRATRTTPPPRGRHPTLSHRKCHDTLR